jgi:hypothetical protein
MFGLASARASREDADAAFVAAGSGGGAAATTVGAGGGTIVGIDVSNSILSGHFCVEWIRAIGTSACPEASRAGAGSALGHIQLATKSNAASTLPTKTKYRARGTAISVSVASPQCDDETNARCGFCSKAITTRRFTLNCGRSDRLSLQTRQSDPQLAECSKLERRFSSRVFPDVTGSTAKGSPS